MDHCIRHLLLTHTELETAFSRKEQMYLCTIQQEEGITQATVPGEIQAVLDNYADVLRGLPSGLPPTRAVAHSIELEPGHAPPLWGIYPPSSVELEELRKQIEELIKNGYIRPSVSPYGAPVLIVKKKSGELWMCVDSHAQQDHHQEQVPLPRIDEMLDLLNGTKYFTRMDLASGYH